MPVITGPEAVHISQVLRYKIGDLIGLFDGCGVEYEARITTLQPQRVGLTILRRFTSKDEQAAKVTVAQGYLKDRKMDALVRQLSELGATDWIPFKAKRTVAVPDKKRMTARKARWEKIAIEAAKQCGRSRVMSISPTESLHQIINNYSDFDHRIVFWEKETSLLQAPGALDSPRPAPRIIIVLGPEGGLDSEEINALRSKGFETFSLGPRILRAETAAIVACTLVQYIFGDLGQQSA